MQTNEVETNSLQRIRMELHKALTEIVSHAAERVGGLLEEHFRAQATEPEETSQRLTTKERQGIGLRPLEGTSEA